ncbi:MAG: pyridoxamine 5'-phosphate oxidase family protein [Acidimicrobiia bacterium]
MTSWAAFEAAAPEFGVAGRRLLAGSDGVPIAFLATVTRRGRPHLSPACPIFSGENLYLSAGAATPKVSDLRASSWYALHAFLADSDEEFQVAGSALELNSEPERSRVHADIKFGAFSKEDPRAAPVSVVFEDHRVIQ